MVLCCVSLSLSLDIQNMHLCRWFWGRGPTSRPSCVWKFNHFTNLRESTTQSYRKDDRNGVIEVEQLWFTGKLWKLIKTYWTYGSTFSSLLYFRQIHRLGKGKTGKCSNSNKKTSVRLEELLLRTVMALNAGRVFLGDDNWCMLMIPVTSTVHPEAHLGRREAILIHYQYLVIHPETTGHNFWEKACLEFKSWSNKYSE